MKTAFGTVTLCNVLVRVAFGIGLVSAALRLPSGAEEMAVDSPSAAPVRNAVRGAWNADIAGMQELKSWNVEISRQTDDVVEGSVTLEGSPLMTQGSFRGKLDGRAIVGTISDDNGRQVATFAGKLTDGGIFEGRYEDRTGEGGRWTADAPRAP